MDVWTGYIAPHYYNNKVGRRARDLEMMLRMYLLQTWFSLSDEGVEEAIYDSYAMRKFMKINFLEEQVPDATTLLKFRRIMEEKQLGKVLFDVMTKFLEAHGHMMKGGSVVDATIIQAPSSTKNKEGKRDPEMRSTRKGNQYHFGMKCHIGVDAGTGYIHTVETSAANVNDIVVAEKLIREDDEVVYGDAGYLGIEKRKEIKTHEKKAKIDYRINQRPSKYNNLPEGYAKDIAKRSERKKSSIRSKVEHPFHIIKNQFGFKKARYRGIAKNANRLHMLFMSANLLMCAKSGWYKLKNGV